MADEDPQSPQDGQPGTANVAEAAPASGQKVPALQLLRGEALGHLVIHDALHAAAAEVEDIGHLEP